MNTCVHNLNWSHFRSLLRVSDEEARIWYMNEAASENWSVRTLDRNKGFAFVARQQHIVTETEDYYIDLVFIILNCLKQK